MPIDPLAPEHTYRDVDPFLANVYRRVLDAHDSKSIVFMGDSAGGGLALGLCHPVREDQGLNRIRRPGDGPHVVQLQRSLHKIRAADGGELRRDQAHCGEYGGPRSHVDSWDGTVNLSEPNWPM